RAPEDRRRLHGRARGAGARPRAARGHAREIWSEALMRLQGKVAAITGGALGIGRATAVLFASEGATVALGDVEVGAAEAVVKEILQRGGRAIAVGVDVGDSGRGQVCVDRVASAWGRIVGMFP